MTEQEQSAKEMVTGSESGAGDVLQCLGRIEGELKRLNSHKLISFFARGIVFGLGSVIGATLVVSVLVFLLSQIEFVPIIGEWVKNIVQEIQN